MKINELPSLYIPFKEFEIGTNRLIDGLVLFSLDDNVPLLIGVNGCPRIWLSIPADEKGESWQIIVRDNKSLHPKVTVNVNGNTVIVDTPDNGIVLKVNKENERLVKVQQINLRPFGINIYGDESSLTIMNNNLSGNTFTGTKIMIGIGGEKVHNKGVEQRTP
jgi:hypothetical protein